jgi:Putative stress-induced transcription regulator
MLSQRTKGITIKVTDDEYTTFTRLAGGQTVSAWVHEVVLATTTPRPADHVLLAEFLAVRTILLNLHFAAVTGDPPTAEAMKRLIERADADKLRKAQERFASVCQRRKS